MPRKKAKPPPTIATVIGLFAMLIGIWLGIRFGAFNWLGSLLVNHSINSSMQEAERQKAAIEERQKAAAAKK